MTNHFKGHNYRFKGYPITDLAPQIMDLKEIYIECPYCLVPTERVQSLDNRHVYKCAICHFDCVLVAKEEE